MNRVPQPVEIAGHLRRRPEAEREAEPMLVLLLARGHAQFHDRSVIGSE
jgi:hypothetical protein